MWGYLEFDQGFLNGGEYAEIAEVLKVSERTVQSDWRQARSWLLRELRREKCDERSECKRDSAQP